MERQELLSGTMCCLLICERLTSKLCVEAGRAPDRPDGPVYQAGSRGEGQRDQRIS